MSTYSIAARKARWRAQLEQSAPPEHLFLIVCDPGAPPYIQPWPSLKKERIERAWQLYQRHCARVEWLRDDSIPCLAVETGTEIFAEAFGCRVHRPEDNMPFALPLLDDPAGVAKLRVPELSTSSLAILFDMADELQRRAGTDAIFRMVDIQSPMDIAALIWDKNSFYAAMVEAPEAVQELASKVATLQTDFFDEWFARYGADFIAHYPNYYMPQGVTLSEDEVGVVSTDMFEEFFLPELKMLSLRYGGLGMHCCANSRHQWENFLRIPGLRLLNLVQPPEVLRLAYPFFAGHVAQFHGGLEGAPENWPSQVPANARIVIEAGVDTPDEARALSDKLWAACGRE